MTIVLLVLLCLLHRVYAYNYSTAFVQTTSPYADWIAGSCSDSGQIIFAAQDTGFLYQSNDYGYTWIQSYNLSGAWGSIVTTIDGNFVVAAMKHVGVFMSGNSGLTWKLGFEYSAGFNVLTMSSNGQYIVAAAAYNTTFYSNNSGTSWYHSYNGVKNVYDNYDWVDGASSDSGQIVYLVIGSLGDMFKSVDYGVTFQRLNSSEKLGWNTVDTNGNGSIVVGGQSNDAAPGYIYISFNYGRNFTQTIGSVAGFWKDVTCVNDCQTILACQKPGYLYASNDYGKTFLQMTNEILTWDAIISSSNSQYITALVYVGFIYFNAYSPTSQPSSQPSALPSSSLPSIQPTSHPTLTPTSSPTLLEVYSTDLILSPTSPIQEWTSMAMSGSGQYLVATASEVIYTSNNFGYTWVLSSAPDRDWQCVASSESGQIVYAGGFDQLIYISTDYGVTWNNTGMLSIQGRQWTALAVNSSGQMVVAVSEVNQDGPKIGASMFISYNFGQNWTQIDVGNTNSSWKCVTVSASGQYVSAGAHESYIYTSVNYGKNFTIYDNRTNHWSGICSSSSGQYLVATVKTGDEQDDGTGAVFQSIDFGQTWSFLDVPHSSESTQFADVACSASGQFLVATNYEGYVIFSSNYGNEWAISPSGTNLWQFVVSSSDGKYVAVNGGFSIYINSYSPTSQPSSAPSRSPASNPSAIPSISPTSMPSKQPHTSNPSSFPTSVPSNQPTSSPTNYPTFYGDWAVTDFVVYSRNSISTYTFNNLGCGSVVYLSASILVSYLDQFSGGFINITAGVNENMLIISQYCAPTSTCGTAVCAINIDVSSATTCEGGGSVVLTSSVVNANQYSGLQSYCTSGGQSNLLFAMQYTVSAEPQPTAYPTHAPTESNANFVFEANPSAPFYIITVFSFLCGVLGVFIVRLRDKSGFHFSDMTIKSTCFDTIMIGYHLITELFYIVLLFSEGGDVLYALASLVVVIRLVSFISAIYFLLLALGPTSISVAYGKKVNKKHFFSNAAIYAFVILLMFFDQSMIRYIPWTETPFTAVSRGFPDKNLYRFCMITKLVQVTLTLVIQIVVLGYSDAYLFSNGADTIELAIVLLYLISSTLSFIVYAVTNFIRLRMSDVADGEVADDKTMKVQSNPIHVDVVGRETELSIVKQSTYKDVDNISLSVLVARVQALEESNMLLKESNSELRSIVLNLSK